MSKVKASQPFEETCFMNDYDIQYFEAPSSVVSMLK